MNAQYFLNNVIQRNDLTADESTLLLTEMMNGSFTEIQISSLLTAFAMKGETVDEIAGFIKTMRKRMIFVHADNAIDVCGTGGDGKKTFNISTIVAFVVAGAGIKVAKHGNRAASSNCGSADVLEKLGVNTALTGEQAEMILQNVGMVFLFAPLFHPSMKFVSTVRKELQVRTVFNFLGPFANPAGVKRQLIGVPSIGVAEKLAQVAKKLDYEHVFIVTSEDGMDEVSVNTKTYLYEIKKNTVSRFVIDPREYGFSYKATDICGGDAKRNAEMIRNILSGGKGSQRDIVTLNSAFALYVAGKVKDVHEGVQLAEQSIDNGSANKILENLIKETQHYA